MATGWPPITEEICCFSKDLFNYLWLKYSLNSNHPSSEHLNFEDVVPEEKNKKYFDKEIGEAVRISQYLLRDMCRFFFNCIGKDLIYSKSFFFMCIAGIIREWLKRRIIVHHKVVDAAAIIMEAIMHCNLNLKANLEERLGPLMFSWYFENRLKEEFYEKGGWEELKRLAFDHYVPFYYVLGPFLRVNTIGSAETHLNCKIIKTLQRAPVMFPVEVSRICKECKKILPDNFRNLPCYPSTFFRWKPFFESDIILTKEEVLEKIKDFKRIESESSTEAGEATKDGPCENFLCLFLGGIVKEVKKPENKRLFHFR